MGRRRLRVTGGFHEGEIPLPGVTTSLPSHITLRDTLDANRSSSMFTPTGSLLISFLRVLHSIFVIILDNGNDSCNKGKSRARAWNIFVFEDSMNIN
jgi:hypothetical protein